MNNRLDQDQVVAAFAQVRALPGVDHQERSSFNKTQDVDVDALVQDGKSSCLVASVVTSVIQPHCHTCVKCLENRKLTSSRLLKIKTDLAAMKTELSKFMELTEGFRVFGQLAQVSENKWKKYVFGNAWPENQSLVNVVSQLDQPTSGFDAAQREKYEVLKERLNRARVPVSEYVQAIQTADRNGNDAQWEPGKTLATWVAEGRDALLRRFECLVEEEAINEESLALIVDGYMTLWVNPTGNREEDAGAGTSSSPESGFGDTSTPGPRRGFEPQPPQSQRHQPYVQPAFPFGYVYAPIPAVPTQHGLPAYSQHFVPLYSAPALAQYRFTTDSYYPAPAYGFPTSSDHSTPAQAQHPAPLYAHAHRRNMDYQGHAYGGQNQQSGGYARGRSYQD